MKLVKLTIEHYGRFTEMAEDYTASGDDRYIQYVSPKGFESYLEKLEKFENEETVPEGLEPSFSYWLQDKNLELLGAIRYRPKLNKELLIEGGNIGFDIRPSQRNKGNATIMLGLLIEKLKREGINKILITCDEDNLASEKVIIKHNGKFDSTGPSPDSGKMVKRYWIYLTGMPVKEKP